MWVYSDEVKENFTNPKNILNDGEEFVEDGRGETGSSVCGDMMVMFIKVDKEKNIIKDCKWKTYGCASAIASTSMLSEMVKGMTLEEAYKIKPLDVIKELNGLPNHKIHCSVLGDQSLRAAIDDYFKRNNIPNYLKVEKDKIICECLNISKSDIKKTVFKDNINTFEELQDVTKISTSCGKCEQEARAVFEEFLLEKEENK
ncbi:MAG: iron-sulfur cluster assembly scaffold protein [Bacteroidales bacterium]|nr:iron-sulfur cluster assembly scaffold protein [Bacteroidales bacterium]